MTTKDQILFLVRQGESYEAIGEALGITGGLAYLIATGLTADGSDVLPEEELRREGRMDGSTQALANPRYQPVVKEKPATAEWREERAASDTTMTQAYHSQRPDAMKDRDAAPA